MRRRLVEAATWYASLTFEVLLEVYRDTYRYARNRTRGA